MNSLSDLKTLFINNNVKVTEFNGYSVKVKEDIYTMAHGDIYKNGVVTTVKEIFPPSTKKKK